MRDQIRAPPTAMTSHKLSACVWCGEETVDIISMFEMGGRSFILSADETPLAEQKKNTHQLNRKKMKSFPFLLALICLSLSSAFVTRQPKSLLVTSLSRATTATTTTTRTDKPSTTSLFRKISQERRRQLGILDDEDEYDLGYALETNTDPLISKIIAGSLIVVVIALLAVGVIIPLTTDYGEGVCNPILNAGRC